MYIYIYIELSAFFFVPPTSPPQNLTDYSFIRYYDKDNLAAINSELVKLYEEIEKEFKLCGLCGYHFRSSNYFLHMKIHLLHPGDQMKRCLQCDIILEKGDDKVKHELLHTE
jgi:hypothetical protein